MRKELHRYLDGEIPRDSLSPEAAAELAEWSTLARAASALEPAAAPPWLEERVMASLPPEPARSPAKRAWDWFVRARPVRVRPASLALAGGVLALLLAVWPGTRATPPPSPGFAVAAADDELVYVQFVFIHPDAASVAVAGDFNGWDATRHVLRDVRGDGVWTGRIAIPTGMHKYMFVVDGEDWVTDPNAERHLDDGFGMRNAVLTVAPPMRRSS